MRRFALAALLAVSGCVEPAPVMAPQAQPLTPVDPGPAWSAGAGEASFRTVSARMEPVMERECRARARGANCDFAILIDDRPGQPANAYQTIGASGRPVIGFTRALLSDMRNADELAFVLGHEAAHHISGHIPRQGRSALGGALIFGALAAASGADETTLRTAQDIGASVGSRVYSKDFELEADALGTILTFGAGYDPERGAAYFTRIPDPGDRVLGSHPPNSRRLDTVRQTLGRIRAGAI